MRWLAAVVLGSTLLLACNALLDLREADVVLDGGPGAPSDGGVQGGGDARPTCPPSKICSDDLDCCAGSRCFRTAGDQGVCVKEAATSCGRGQECIGGTCTQGACACGGWLSVCFSSKECCSMGSVCAGVGALAATTGNCCRTVAVSCEAGIDCCSLSCEKGVCSCGRTGTRCATGAECCSAKCAPDAGCQ